MEQPLTQIVISDFKQSFKNLRSEVMRKEIPHETYEEVIVRTCNRDRFLVNLYESPIKIPTLRKSTKTIENQHCIIVDPSDKKQDCKNNAWLSNNKATMEQYLHLRIIRDKECIRIKEASNILQHLNRQSPFGFWFERLVAEKVLLESGYAIDVLKNKISEKYVETGNKNVQIGTVSLSTFTFHLNKEPPKSEGTEFFILILSNDTDVKTSKITRSSNSEVVFDEKFSFPITQSFKIQFQLHSILLKETSKISTLARSVICNHSPKRTLLKLQYKNLNTSNFEETNVLKSSFTLRAKAEVLPSNIHNKAWELSLEENSLVNEFATFSATIDEFEIKFKRSGFLTLGTHFKESVLWNRRWCALKSNLLKIYGSPSEDVFNPILTINLTDCLESKIEEAPRTLCNRPRSFAISVNENRSNVTKNVLFFMADTNEDLKQWVSDLNVIVDLLKFKSLHKF